MKIKTSLFAERRDEISCMPEDSITKARKKKSKGNALNRLAELWTPFNKSVILQGVRDEHGKVVRDPAQLFSCLASAWSKTFSSKPFDSVQAQAFLENHCPAYSHDATPPTPQDFANCIRSVMHSSPGSDGIPYCGWASPDGAGAMTLWLVAFQWHRGNYPPISFNASSTVFLTKGELEEDQVEVIRDPSATRPLGLKNTDNKIITGVTILIFASTGPICKGPLTPPSVVLFLGGSSPGMS